MLLIMLIICAEGVPLLEQPISSLLNHHIRFRELVDLLMRKGIRTLVPIHDLIDEPFFHQIISGILK